MPIVYSNAVKVSRSNVVITALGAAATLVIGDNTLSGATGVLAKIPLANPAFTNAVGVMTMASAPRTVNAIGAGNASKAELRDASDVVIASGLTVGTSGTDVIINAVSITVGQSVQATVGSITPTS